MRQPDWAGSNLRNRSAVGKPTRQPRALLPIRRNLSRMVETNVVQPINQDSLRRQDVPSKRPYRYTVSNTADRSVSHAADVTVPQSDKKRRRRNSCQCETQGRTMSSLVARRLKRRDSQRNSVTDKCVLPSLLESGTVRFSRPVRHRARVRFCPALPEKNHCFLVTASWRLKWIWSAGGMILTGENRSTGRKICPSATMSTTNLMYTDLGSTLGLRGERPATDRFSHSRLQINLNYIYIYIYIYIKRSSPYRAVNTLRLGYTNQSVNAV